MDLLIQGAYWMNVRPLSGRASSAHQCSKEPVAKLGQRRSELPAGVAAEPQFRAKTAHQQFDARKVATHIDTETAHSHGSNTLKMAEYDNLSSDLIWEITRKPPPIQSPNLQQRSHCDLICHIELSKYMYTSADDLV